jgi:hypothetical protein
MRPEHEAEIANTVVQNKTQTIGLRALFSRLTRKQAKQDNVTNPIIYEKSF